MSKPYDGQLAEICEKFRIESSLDSVETLIDGIINKTFKVNFTSGKSYLLQQINSFVFARPEQVMGNIDLVTAHIMKKNPDGCNLHFHHTADGKNYYIDKNGSFWRLRNFLDAVTFNTCDDIAVLKTPAEPSAVFRICCRISTPLCSVKPFPGFTIPSLAWKRCLSTPRPTRWEERQRQRGNSILFPLCVKRQPSFAK